MAGHPAPNLSVRCAVSQSGRATCENLQRGSPTAITSATPVTARTGLEQNDARAARIDSAKILGQGLAGNLGDGPGHFDAGRSSTDDDEAQQTLPLGIIIAGKLGLLECQQNASANAGRIFNTLEPGCKLGPIVMPEIGMRRAGRDHEIVV